MSRAGGWTARAWATWGAVLGAGLLALAAAVLPAVGGPPAPAPGPAGWLVLAALAGAAVLLGLRPAELGPDWKVSLATAPALALALLYPPAWAAPAGAAAMAAAQLIARRPPRVALFNVAQRTLAGAGAAAAAAGAGVRLPALAGLAALAGALVYFLVNTGCVAAMVAARRGAGWPAAWRDLARADGPAEAGLLAAGALFAVLLREAPVALLGLVPPVWLARRALADAARIRRLNARLEGALAEQRRCLADAAHELRTPVAVLRALVALLRQEFAPPPDGSGAAGAGRARGADPDVVEMLAQMAQATARLTAMLADLLTLARADEGEAVPAAVAPVDVEALLVAVYREVQPLAGGVRLTLDVDGGADAPVVGGDAERLRQMLLNLVTNALRFTPPDGRVALRCRQADGHAELRVEDSGVGIAPADLPHVFDRFYRADPARARRPAAGDRGAGGAGLGLAIARWAAESHGGTIAVASAPGRGSVFTVRLPLAPPAGSPAGATARHRGGRRRRAAGPPSDAALTRE
jgi:signal transduction histidine kinase